MGQHRRIPVKRPEPRGCRRIQIIGETPDCLAAGRYGGPEDPRTEPAFHPEAAGEGHFGDANRPVLGGGQDGRLGHHGLQDRGVDRRHDLYRSGGGLGLDGDDVLAHGAVGERHGVLQGLRDQRHRHERRVERGLRHRRGQPAEGGAGGGGHERSVGVAAFRRITRFEFDPGQINLHAQGQRDRNLSENGPGHWGQRRRRRSRPVRTPSAPARQ